MVKYHSKVEKTRPKTGIFRTLKNGPKWGKRDPTKRDTGPHTLNHEMDCFGTPRKRAQKWSEKGYPISTNKGVKHVCKKCTFCAKVVKLEWRGKRTFENDGT